MTTTFILPALLIYRFTPKFVIFILFRKLWHELGIKCLNISLVIFHNTFTWFRRVPCRLPAYIPRICNKSTIRKCEFSWTVVEGFACFWVTNVKSDFEISIEPLKSLNPSALSSTAWPYWIFTVTFVIDYQRCRTKYRS